MTPVEDQLHTIPEGLEIKPLERFDFYAWLGLVRVMEPETEALMIERAERELVEDEHDSPHQNPWHVSFHGSEFPGEPADACERYLAYRMMNFPSAAGAMPPWVTTTGTVGKAGELDIADAWFSGGRLLAIPEDPEMRVQHLELALAAYKAGQQELGEHHEAASQVHQLGFVDPEHWMTVSTDLPILPKGWRRPHIVEIKGKADTVLDEMIEGRLLRFPDDTIRKVGRGPDQKHANQVRATIGKAHDFDWGWVTVCPNCWFIVWSEMYERLGLPGGMHPRSDGFGYCPRCRDYGDASRESHFHLDPPTTGEIYYWSRSWPRKTKSFYYELDSEFMRRGFDVLSRVREYFIEDTIPPRPDDFQWSVGPCKNCQHKPFCRIDFGLPEPRLRKPRPDLVRTALSKSAGVDHAREIRTNYDPDAIRRRVFEQWGHVDG